MALVSRKPLPTEQESTSPPSCMKKLKWAINEVLTAVLSMNNASPRDGDTLLIGACVSLFGGIILMGLNNFACTFLDYMTDWDVPEFFYPVTFVGIPAELVMILSISEVVRNNLRYKNTYTYDKAEESLEYIFSDFKKIPSAYWKASQAFIEHPKTLTCHTLHGGLMGFAAVYLPMVAAGGIALGFDLIRCELSGYKMNQYSLPVTPTVIYLGTGLLASAASTLTGFNLGLVQGVEAVERNREDEKPTAIQSASRFLRKFSFYRVADAANTDDVSEKQKHKRIKKC